MILQKLSINGLVLHLCCVLPQQLKEKKKKVLVFAVLQNFIISDTS